MTKIKGILKQPTSLQSSNPSKNISFSRFTRSIKIKEPPLSNEEKKLAFVSKRKKQKSINEAFNDPEYLERADQKRKVIVSFRNSCKSSDLNQRPDRFIPEEQISQFSKIAEQDAHQRATALQEEIKMDEGIKIQESFILSIIS